VIRRKDNPGSCWREAGVKEITLTVNDSAQSIEMMAQVIYDPSKSEDYNKNAMFPSGATGGLMGEFMALARGNHAIIDSTFAAFTEQAGATTDHKSLLMECMQNNMQLYNQSHPPFDMGESIARLRIANARMLALAPSTLENLEPSAGVSSNPEHGAKLLNFFRRVVPDLSQRDLHELIKWGKWREYRKTYTVIQKQGEHPYYLGVLLHGQLDVGNSAEDGTYTFKKSIKENELVGSEEFQTKVNVRAKSTIRVSSPTAVMFVWDLKDLTRLMLADPRVESVISTLIRGDITLKLRDSQSLTNRACGQIDAFRRDTDGRGMCGPGIGNMVS